MNSRNRSVAIVAAEFNITLIDAMVEVATSVLRENGAVVAHLVRVPGSYEIPLVASLLIGQDNVDALVVLGYIERGETLHGEVMGHVVSEALVQLQIQYRKPIGLGIIGPGATAEQAAVRMESSARAAAQAVLKMADLVDEIGTS